MRTHFIKIIRWILLAWGAVSLIGAIIAAGFVVYTFFGPGNRDKNDKASSGDVRFVLNWCGLGDQRIAKVTHSHVSAVTFTGQHLDAYAISISHIDLAELTPKGDGSLGHWYRGDQLPKVLDDAVSFVGVWRYEMAWFPTEAELRSSNFYVFPWSIDYQGTRPSGANLIFLRPADKMIFFFGAQM